MRSVKFLVVSTLLLAGCAGQARETIPVQQVRAPARSGPEAAAELITPQAIRRQVEFLASDEMRGRDTPSPELERAAEYIAEEFQSFGLQPGGDDGTYIQRFALQRRALDREATSLVLKSGGRQVDLEQGTDFAAYAGVPSQVEAPIVAVEGEIDGQLSGVAGRVVITRLAGRDLTREVARSLERQREAAREAGAAAVIFVVDPEFPSRTISVTATFNSRPQRLAPGVARDIPAFLLSQGAAEKVGEALGADLGGLLASPATGPARVIPGVAEGVTAAASAPVRLVEDHRAPNVIGILPGSDPELRNTYVVFSAHFDHVGVDDPDASGDSIYNGADDNASGTAALIEVARAFAALDEAPARSLLFLAVSAEEKGLLGSKYYSDNPTVPIESIVANINVDMIGRNAPDSIVVIGQEYSSLGPLVQEVARARPEIGLTVAQDIWPEQRFFFRSDHYNFARKEIPALFFFAGVHEDYHRPSDEIEKLDTEKAARVAKMVFFTAYEIASRPEPPTWTEEGLREVRALTAAGR